MTRQGDMINLYEKGFTFARIGRKYGISRQRVWEILKPLYRKLNNNKRVGPTFGRLATELVIPSKHELYIYKKLKRMGLNVELQPYNAPFDLLVNGKKTQVKYRNWKKSGRVRFNFLKDKEETDFLILTMIKGNHKKNWIFPKGSFSNFKHLSWKKKYKSHNTKFIEKWVLLRD